MAIQFVEFKRNGGQPEIELEFGFAQFAQYRINLWDTTGKNKLARIGEGVNVDTVPDKWPIEAPLATLDGCFITWQAIIASPTGGANEQYSMKGTFTQDGQNCDDGPFNRQGALDPDPKIVYDRVQIKIV